MQRNMDNAAATGNLLALFSQQTSAGVIVTTATAVPQTAQTVVYSTVLITVSNPVIAPKPFSGRADEDAYSWLS
jgi:hypothetical protein